MTMQAVTTAVIFFTSLLSIPENVFSETIKAGQLQINDSHIRATPPEAPVAAGYVSILNTGTESERLLGAAALFARKTEIHEMQMVDDVMRMRPVDSGVTISAGETVTLGPKGLHLMFMHLKEQMKEGEQRIVTLVFEKQGEVRIFFGVKDFRRMELKKDKEHSHQ